MPAQRHFADQLARLGVGEPYRVLRLTRNIRPRPIRREGDAMRHLNILDLHHHLISGGIDNIHRIPGTVGLVNAHRPRRQIQCNQGQRQQEHRRTSYYHGQPPQKNVPSISKLKQAKLVTWYSRVESRRSSLTVGPQVGEMAERIAAFDWSTTPLGPLDHWPQSLRTVVNILLTSRYAMWMALGDDLTMLYNDAYSPTLGIKHPKALGTPAGSVWAEIWSDIGPRIQTVLTTGKATYDEGLLLFLERSGFPEETYHTFSYSPLTDEDGRINGMLCVVTEETDRVIGERRVESLRDVASALASTNTEEEVLEALRDQLSLNPKDLPFSLTYLFDQDGGARLASYTGIPSEHPLAASRIEPISNYPW